MSRPWLLSSGGGTKREGTWSPWQGPKVASSSHAKGGDSPVLGLSTQMWPGLPANISGVCGRRAGQFPVHSRREIKGGEAEGVLEGRRDVLLAWGSECWKEGLALGLSFLCVC